MTVVKDKAQVPIQNDNLKNLKPFASKKGGEHPVKTPVENTKPDVSHNAKNLKTDEAKKVETPKADSNTDIMSKASDVAEAIAKAPVLPVVAPKISPTLEKKINDQKEKVHLVKKPAVIFIEGFSAFGLSNGDGIKDMAENFPNAMKFDWSEKDKIIAEIKKHSPEQPVVLVGHSLGGQAAIDIANELNSAKNGFRSIDLIASLDSVGFNNSIIPMNVKRNLNFFQEGMIPFLHGNPTVARNTDYTEVTNELRNELHSKIDDSPEVQFKIFEAINDAIAAPQAEDVVVQMSLKDFIDSQLSFAKKE